MRWTPVAILLLLVAMAPAASAELSGPCTGTIQGVDVAPLSSKDPADAITIDKDDDVQFRLTAQGEVDSWVLHLRYGPFKIPVARDNDPTPPEEGDDWIHNDTLNADTYAWMGRGIFRLTADIQLEDDRSCEGAVLVDLGGNALGSLMGVLALVLVAAGTIGIIVGFVQNSDPHKATRRPTEAPPNRPGGGHAAPPHERPGPPPGDAPSAPKPSGDTPRPPPGHPDWKQ